MNKSQGKSVAGSSIVCAKAQRYERGWSIWRTASKICRGREAREEAREVTEGGRGKWDGGKEHLKELVALETRLPNF